MMLRGLVNSTSFWSSGVLVRKTDDNIVRFPVPLVSLVIFREDDEPRYGFVE